MTNQTTRRALFGAAAALAAAPAVAATTAAKAFRGVTPIQILWSDVVNLSVRLGAFSAQTTAAERPDGLPGWMYVQGEANDLGNARYDKLVAILHGKPEAPEDLAIMARAAQHRDIVEGPKSYAANRLAEATLFLHAA